MGQIQQSLNQSLSGAAFLLNQSGIFDEARETTRLNKAGEKKLKETEAIYQAKEAGLAEADKNTLAFKPEQKEAKANTIENLSAEYRTERDKNIADIKKQTPKYRQQIVVNDAMVEARDAYNKAIESLAAKEKTKSRSKATVKTIKAGFNKGRMDPVSYDEKLSRGGKS